MNRKFFVALLILFSSIYSSSAETLVDKLLKSYEQIITVTCEVRRTTKSSAGKARFLSRVYYKKPDCIHIDNITPLKRRIVADGSRFYSYIEGDPKGFSRTVDKLNDKMLISLRKVPGTAMDHLLRLKETAEETLKPEQNFPVKKGYQADKNFVVLSLDAKGRLARIEFFNSSEMRNKTAQYDYSNFNEVLPDLWIPCLHHATARIGDIESEETVRITNLTANKPIAKSLFIAAPFFKKVEFVDNFEDVYK
ncbi:outer membrane lipoprotein carrier protein LolA [Verrucomicrobiota bacterium]